jgi:hypothetical protein
MAYADDAYQSETIRHSDKKANPTQAGHTAADIAHFTRMLAAEAKWGTSNGAIAALRSLGKFPSEIQVPQNTGGNTIT